MIKAKDLKSNDQPGYRFGGEAAQQINISLLKALLEEVNEEKYGLPISVTIDQVTSGGLFNSTVEDCLVITNTEHSGYFKFVTILRKQGKFATLSWNYYGYSELTYQKAKTESRSGLGGMLMNAINGVNEQAYIEEYEYYHLLRSIFEEVCAYK